MILYKDNANSYLVLEVFKKMGSINIHIARTFSCLIFRELQYCFPINYLSRVLLSLFIVCKTFMMGTTHGADKAYPF